MAIRVVGRAAAWTVRSRESRRVKAPCRAGAGAGVEGTRGGRKWEGFVGTGAPAGAESLERPDTRERGIELRREGGSCEMVTGAKGFD